MRLVEKKGRAWKGFAPFLFLTWENRVASAAESVKAATSRTRSKGARLSPSLRVKKRPLHKKERYLAATGGR